MQESKPGKKLNPLLARYTLPIYTSDPIRYQNIARFVWHCQKQGWPDEAIAAAFELAGEKIHVAANWWSYLFSLLPKAKGRASEAEAQSHKTEVGRLADDFLAFVKQRRAG